MKPLQRCTTPSPSPTLPHKNATAGNADLGSDNPSECNGNLGEKDTSAASPSSSSSATLSSRRVVRSRVRKRIRPRVLWAPRGSGGGSPHDNLALPLGMSFAAVLSQIMNRSKQGERTSLELFSRMCTAAVKESVTNKHLVSSKAACHSDTPMGGPGQRDGQARKFLHSYDYQVIYGDQYDHFMSNFENSFTSTLQTLHLLSHTSIPDREESMPYRQSDRGENVNISNGTSIADQEESMSHPHSDRGDDVNISNHHIEYPHGMPHLPLGPTTSTQIILHSNMNNQLSNVSRNRSQQNHEINQQIITTLERSVTEQVRSNNLKEIEMGLTMKKLELKRSQLELSSYAHMMERVKVRMGMAKAMFREEKLKNQMQDVRFLELVKTFIDVLVTGLIIMSVCFSYGTYIFSYQRITEVTESCSAISKGSNSWWVPKQVSTINSGLLILRCHAVALTRLGFGIIMFLALAWLIVQKSSVVGSNMPITFNVMLLGVFCGFTGKWCVDSLGGNGLFWLILWEMLCLIHLVVNAFPSSTYRLLHGPVTVSQGIEVVKRPYWIWRYMLYVILVFILPVSAGLLPFASVFQWMEHLRETIRLMNIGEEGEL